MSEFCFKFKISAFYYYPYTCLDHELPHNSVKVSGNKQTENNFPAFSDVEVEALISCRTLESVNLEENPLSRQTSEVLANINNIRITLTPREVEEWEDLSIQNNPVCKRKHQEENKTFQTIRGATQTLPNTKVQLFLQFVLKQIKKSINVIHTFKHCNIFIIHTSKEKEKKMYE